MANGKDGFEALSVDGGAETIVDDENGVLISMMLRQYFLSLKIVGKWHRGTALRGFFSNLKDDMKARGEVVSSDAAEKNETEDDSNGVSGSDSEVETASHAGVQNAFDNEYTVSLMRRTLRKWERLAGIDNTTRELGPEFNVSWTTAISPKIEGRIVDLTHPEDAQKAVVDTRHPDEISVKA